MKKLFCVPSFARKTPTARPFSELSKFYEVDWTSVLGTGGFSTVYRGREKASGKVVAIKKIPRQGGSSNKVLKQEINALMKVKEHRSIVRLSDVFVAADVVILCLEFMEGDVLFKRIVSQGPLPEVLARKYFYRIAHALKHLHGNNIVHRDVKPENLMFSISRSESGEAELKLTDFGLSKILPDNSNTMATFCGTPAYLAPEAWAAQFEGQYNAKVDTWSFGVTLFVAISGYHPFDPKGTADLKLLRDNILELNWGFHDPGWAGITSECKDLLRRLMCPEQSRLSAEKILQHPWMQPEAEKDAFSVGGSVGSSASNSMLNKLKGQRSLSERIKKLNITTQQTNRVTGKRPRIDVINSSNNKAEETNVTSSFTTSSPNLKKVNVDEQMVQQ